MDRVIEACPLYHKVLWAILFDGGFRMDELLHVKLKHINKIDENGNQYYLIRIEESKTKPRTISIPLYTKIVKSWLENHPAKGNSDAYLIPMGRSGISKALARKGQQLLGKRVYPHLLRHSSATYYCNKLTPYQLCYRYGWTMSSKQPTRYIDREGIFEKDTARLVMKEQNEKHEDENKKLRNQVALLNDELSRMRQRMGQIKSFDTTLNSDVGNEELRKMITQEIIRLGKTI